jgi:hypothetical protein
MMKPLKVMTLFLLLAPTLATVHAKTKKPYKLPAVFNQAQYVWVEAVDGQEYDPRLLPEDRQAIGDVYQALNHWGRYVITARRDEAQLIFVVRKGRVAEEDVAAGRRVGLGAGTAVAGRSELGSPDDLLEVYMPNPNGGQGALLWQRMLAGGLDPPDLALFQQLKDEVNRTYPSPTASKAPKH